MIIEGIKGFLPADSPYREALDKAHESLQESQKLRAGGDVKGAERSNQEVQTEMKRLLSLVSQRESAQEARRAMTEAKAQTEQKSSGEKNMLYRLAGYEEANADEAFARNDFSGANALYRVLGQIYTLCGQCVKDENCVQIMQSFVKTLRSEVEKMSPDFVDQWLYGYAKEIENQALSFQAREGFTNAAGAYLQAAFLYEKIKENAADQRK
ncbi:MAG: hypothetical protein WCC06_03015 [Candidatus Aminicenantales bacterium]